MAAVWQATVLLADPHPLWLDAASKLVAAAGLNVIGRVTPGTEALQLLTELPPDVLITEIPPAAEALSVGAYVSQARALAPQAKIIVLSASNNREVIEEALASGAKGYVPKTAAADDLVATIRLALDDRVFLVNDLPPQPPAPSADPAPAESSQFAILTRREVEILRLVADGLTNSELARKLSLSEQTIKFHLSNIYRKTGSTNRTAASRWALTHGLLTDVDDRVGVVEAAG